MNKIFTELERKEYKGYEIILKASYYIRKEDALKTMNSTVVFTDGKEYQAILLVLEVKKDSKNELYKESLVSAKKDNFKELHYEYCLAKESILQFAEESIDRVLYEDIITTDLIKFIEKRAIQQDMRGK